MMPLQLVLGRSGAGKTTYCLDAIRGRLSADPDGAPLILLVPEQATFQSEYTLLRGSGLQGMIRAQVLSLRRLALRVMQETGGTALIPIGDEGKNMLLYKIVQRLGNQLELFEHGAGKPGFIERLGELLTEWKRYGINSAMIAERREEAASALQDSALLKRKLHDLQLVYEKLETELAGQYLDSEDYLAHLSTGLSEFSTIRDTEIWIDGFNGFTPKEYVALSSLISTAKKVTITLKLNRTYADGERPGELDLFHPTADAYVLLRELAEGLGVEMLEPIMLGMHGRTVNDGGEAAGRFSSSPMLAHLERHYGGRTQMALSNPAMLDAASPLCGLSLHAAANRRTEVELLARDMLRRVREDRTNWRDMTVMVRNTGDYSDYIEAVFQEYNIPYFLDQRHTTVHHPLVEFIRSALETVLHNWSYEAVFRCIKTELLFPLDGSIPRDQFDWLENFVLAAGIDGWKWLDEKRWRPFIVESLEEEQDAAVNAPSMRAKAEFEAVMAARGVIVPPLQQFGKELEKASNVTMMCEALYRLLEHTGAADRLERWSREDSEAGRVQRSRGHRQLWDGVMNLLDQLVELVGNEPLPPDIFVGMLETGLESLKLGAIPPALDQVLVGSMDRTRSGQVQICYVLGANDGVMPMRFQEDGVLTDQERERLAEEGLVMAPGVKRRLLDERFLIYSALTTPSQHLWMSWSEADEEGKSLLPSEIIRQVRQLFHGLPIQQVQAEPTPAMSVKEQREYIQHPERALSYLITELRSWKQGSEIAPFWWELYNWFAVRPEWQAKLALLTKSLGYVNQEELLTADTAQQLYGVRLRASVSRMERFVSCPFQHFAIHGLKLRERKMNRLEAPDVGQLFHAALSRLAGEEGLGHAFGSASEREIRAAAVHTVDELAPRLQSQILLSSGRYRYIARKLKEIVAQAAIMLSEHARRAAFQPVGLEVDFGPGGTLPPLIIPLQDGQSMEIIGRIDRVDAADTEQGLLLRVLDYKSSVTQLRLEEVAFGLSLQMLTYLDVLVTHSSGWLGKQASPAGVLYFHVHNPLLALSNQMPEAKIKAELRKRFKLRGLVTAEAEAVRLMDNQLETGHSELLPVALKKDGAFYSSSSVVTDKQWDILRDSVRRTISGIGSEISCGKVSIEPYKLGTKIPCQYCDYKAVCQFDPLFDGNEYVRLRKPSTEELWQRLEKGESIDDGNDKGH
ncbi:helicase-exonuclease AddAB subunit AddB [Paenibacillus sp. FSL H8-0537]|uniref:helicase-exonuclease AddAB subunit AddB n=1 Tax=Paenibacillus sp. FSL H8-0537 TaxID=2921399 RepID=UPI00310131CA